MRAILATAVLLAAGCRAAAPPPVKPAASARAFLPPAPRGYEGFLYHLRLSLLPVDGSFDGQEVVVIRSRRAGLAEVDLDAIGLDIREVTEGYEVRRFRVDGEHLRITLEPPAAEGAARSLAIAYKGRPSQELGRGNGLVRGDDQAYTAFHTPTWLPCNFDPADKALLELEL